MIKKVLLVLMLVLALVLMFVQSKKEGNLDRRDEKSENATPEGKLKVANFEGKLEQVNTGCFADAECYIVVDEKHITAIMGWSQEIVGTVQGVEGFGDLENHIGKEVEVYAQDIGDGKYTLYGSEGFYVKLK